MGYGIVSNAANYDVCLRDNNTLWLDVRKAFSPEERSRYKREKHICLSDEAFGSLISFFRVNTFLFDSLEGMATTDALAQEFASRTSESLEEELGASLYVPGRLAEYKHAVYHLAMALGRSRIAFDDHQEHRTGQIKAMLSSRWHKTRISPVNFDFFVRGIVCAETIGPTAMYTNDAALFKHLLPKAQQLTDAGQIKISHPVDYFTSIGIERIGYEKDHSLLPQKKTSLPNTA